MLEHGGQLRAASARYGIQLSDWLDLSTGLNPVSFAPPPIPLDAWSRLPQEQDGLEEAAAHYYGTRDLLPVAGSQAAIQSLPRLRPACRIGVLHPGYAEHAYAWRTAGHDVLPLAAATIETHLAQLDVLVLMQPNNPTGELFSHEMLLRWHALLASRGGWMIVDEAFLEASSAQTLIQEKMPQGLIVLRSLGKFFGLAGARVGFTAAHPGLLSALREILAPGALRAHLAMSRARLCLIVHGRKQRQCGYSKTASVWRNCSQVPVLHPLAVATCSSGSRLIAQKASISGWPVTAFLQDFLPTLAASASACRAGRLTGNALVRRLLIWIWLGQIQACAYWIIQHEIRYADDTGNHFRCGQKPAGHRALPLAGAAGR